MMGSRLQRIALIATVAGLFPSCRATDTDMQATLVAAFVWNNRNYYDPYGGLDPSRYLTGDFSPEGVLVAYNDSTGVSGRLLRLEVAAALERMARSYAETSAAAAHPLVIKVGWRSQQGQLAMWNDRFLGTVPMSVPVDGKTPRERVEIIARYLSPPGSTRHHWGTDVDIGVGPDFAPLQEWLSANVARHGFCFPYNDRALRGNLGLLQENWHLSFTPLASAYRREWLRRYETHELVLNREILGLGDLHGLPSEIVSSVNTECR